MMLIGKGADCEGERYTVYIQDSVIHNNNSNKDDTHIHKQSKSFLFPLCLATSSNAIPLDLMHERPKALNQPNTRN